MIEISKRFPFCAVLFEYLLPDRYKAHRCINPTKTFIKKFLQLSDAEKIHNLYSLRILSKEKSISISEIKRVLPILKKITQKTCDTWISVHGVSALIKEIVKYRNFLNHLKKVNSEVLQAFVLLNRYNLSKQEIKRFLPYLKWLASRGHCKTKKGYISNAAIPSYLSDIIRMEKLLSAADIKFKQPKITHKNIIAHHDYLAIEQRKIQEVNIRFPEPPVPGNENIIPITESHKLFEEGTHMHHCVNSYANQVLSGESYIYHVETPKEKATIEVKVQPSKALAQVRGLCNNPVSEETMKVVTTWAAKHNLNTNNVNQFWI
jgi:hypothetical protein